MAFNKFDPHSEASSRDDALAASSPAAERRAKFLRYAWLISVVYTTMGFGFIAYWLFR